MKPAMFIVIAALIPALTNGCVTNDVMTDQEGAVLALALQRSYREGGFAVVSPNTDVSELGDGSSNKIEDCKKFVLKELQTNDPDIVNLVDKFFERNKKTIRLSIKSSPLEGYIIDRDRTFEKYFEKDGGGWSKWHTENPKARNSTKVSLPAYDAKSGFVLLYVSIVADSLMGSGQMLLYKLEKGDLKFVKRVMLWVS